jgi:glycosyltransferase involved in cell wall biosynthesis
MRGTEGDATFDLFEPRRLDPLLERHGVEPLTDDVRQAETSADGAVRFVLGTLLRSRSLRRRFPRALSEGPGGSYATWLGSRLTERGRDHVRAAFAGPRGDRARRVFATRTDVRELFPLGLTPAGRGPFLDWALAHGRRECDVSAEELLWCLLEADETPDRGLVHHYLLDVDWQRAVPNALTPGGWPNLVRHVTARYGLTGRWPKRLRLPNDVVSAWPDRPGANVLAHFRYASGLQEAAFAVVNGLHAVGLATSRRDLPTTAPFDWRDRDPYLGTERFDTTITVAAVNTFADEWLPRAGLAPRAGVKRVAVWYWELDRVPESYRSRLTWPDEVWAPTEFLAKGFREAVSCPVVPVLPGLSLPSFARKPKSSFGLPDDRFLFLFSFDMGSVMRRKNPLAAIEAFRRAFRPDDRVHFAIKVSRGESRPANLAVLRKTCDEAGVTLIDEVMNREDVLALLAAADCYVSPHRAEGLGLGLAESTLLGVPTIATNYSGNVDFMTADTSYLVDCDLVPIGPDPCPHDPYPPDGQWAAPRIDHLASQMRRAFDEKDETLAMARRAKTHAETLFTPGAFGRRMAERIRLLHGGRS